MRSYRWALIQFDQCAYTTGKSGQRQAHTKGKQCEDTGGRGHVTQGKRLQARNAMSPSKCQKPEETEKDFPQSHPRERGTANTLVSDFQLLEMCDDKFQLF